MIEIGVDIGGTFTDVVLLKGEEELFHTKVPSTPRNLIEGVRRGVEKILALSGLQPPDVDRFIHGTTVATNAVLEHKGAITGTLMTKGCEDTLHIGRQKRARMYDLILEPQTPTFISPRRMTLGITERIDPQGNILLPLDEDEVRAATATLVHKQGVQAIAVCYLFSFQNPVHEQRTKEIIQAEWPSVSVSLSSDIDPTIREYERLCVTAYDAYLRPVIEGYIRSLDKRLAEMGLSVRLQLMQSRGGITSASTATRKPVSMLLSGPAAGVIGGKYAAKMSGIEDLITIDIGGTSCDIALVKEGQVLVSSQSKIGGYPLRVPMVDVATIGAGGGSIAWVDAGGGLRVGPQSAGSDPGPACYGRGGRQPTVTDASLVLGYLNPGFFAGGELSLDLDAAVRAIETVATPLDMDVLSAAYGIHRIVNSRMADEVRLATIYRGYDPRRFSLLLLGGAGPVHGAALAQELSIPSVIVPRTPGVLSAFGLLVANIEHDHVRTFAQSTDRLEAEAMATVMREIDRSCTEKMLEDRVDIEKVQVFRSADLRYRGQSYELEIPFEGEVDEDTIRAIVNRFHDTHERIYGHCGRDEVVEFVNLRTTHVFPLPKPALRSAIGGSSLEAAALPPRQAYFHAVGRYVQTPVFNRYLLPIACPVPGPAIIEQQDTTVVVYPGQSFRVDEAGNIIIGVDTHGG